MIFLTAAYLENREGGGPGGRHFTQGGRRTVVFGGTFRRDFSPLHSGADDQFRTNLFLSLSLLMFKHITIILVLTTPVEILSNVTNLLFFRNFFKVVKTNNLEFPDKKNIEYPWI